MDIDLQRRAAVLDEGRGMTAPGRAPEVRAQCCTADEEGRERPRDDAEDSRKGRGHRGDR